MVRFESDVFVGDNDLSYLLFLFIVVFFVEVVFFCREISIIYSFCFIVLGMIFFGVFFGVGGVLYLVLRGFE